MSRHINKWLSAYMDGELDGNRLQYVESHLAECPTCRAELDALQKLSSLLQEVSAPAFTSPERFASQVSLRLPHRQVQEPKTSWFEIGWWMIPAGLLAAWIFVGTYFFMNDLLSAANTLGLLSSISDWLVFGPTGQAYVSTTLGQFGFLSGESLDWAAATEATTRTSLPQISVQVSIALLYLSWIAIWWARHTRQGRGRLLEG